MRALPGRLYAIVGADERGRGAVELAAMALEGGARVVQLRLKPAPTRAILSAGEAIRELTRRAGAWLIVNDRVDVAIACDADGVHLGQSDLPIAAARRLVGDKIIGVSTHDVAQARAAEAAGADYVGFGPMFTTASKATGYDPRGIARLRAVREAIRVPIVAIGGIDEARAPSLIASGADAVAMISALSTAADADAVRRIVVALDSARRLDIG